MADIALKLGELLRRIPWDKWQKILEEEPEWRYMARIFPMYPFGRFAVAMITIGLNDFQLKGKSEDVYWPKIYKVLASSEPPSSPGRLIAYSGPFRPVILVQNGH